MRWANKVVCTTWTMSQKRRISSSAPRIVKWLLSADEPRRLEGVDTFVYCRLHAYILIERRVHPCIGKGARAFVQVKHIQMVFSCVYIVQRGLMHYAGAGSPSAPHDQN